MSPILLASSIGISRKSNREGFSFTNNRCPFRLDLLFSLLRLAEILLHRLCRKIRRSSPGAIARMRKLAVVQGLQQDVWFNNVERVTAAKIGQEPVRYVRNIYKYYVGYKLLEEQEQATDAAKKGFSSPTVQQ